MALSITPRLIIGAAQRRGWRAQIIDENRSLYRLDLPDGRYFYLRNITSIKSSALNNIIGKQKDVFYRLAHEWGVLVPDTLEYTDNLEEAESFLQKHQRVVVKPVNQAHGKGITTNISTAVSLKKALDFARTYSSRILIQQQVDGDDYRVLIIDDKLAGAAIRKPAFVIGDGKSTIAELITQENASDRRSEGYQASLTLIDMRAAERYLDDRLQEVPAAGVEVRVVGPANVGIGGVALDVTDTLDLALVETARKVTQHLGVGLCGADFLMADDGTAYMIEINTGPTLGLHEYPYQGTPRNTPDAFLDWLAKP